MSIQERRGRPRWLSGSIPAAPRGRGSSVRWETRPSSHNKGGRAPAGGVPGGAARLGGRSCGAQGGGGRARETGSREEQAGAAKVRTGERPRGFSARLWQPRRSRCGSGSRGPAARAPTSNFPGAARHPGRGAEAAANRARLSAPTPSRSGPVGCESSPQPHRRPPAGAQISRGVSGRRRRARSSPPPLVGLSINSDNPQTRETCGPAGVTSPATPGSLSTNSGLVQLPSPTPRQAWAAQHGLG